jgi:YegS/Rv2252/BmrU family lipid kinase
MTAKVILNPYANRWRALDRQEELENALRSAGIDYHIAITDGPGNGIALAKLAVEEGYNPIIAAGGDGSISEVVNGMLLGSKENIPPSLGIMPLGSANDFVVNVGLPLNLKKAAQVISTGNTRIIDLGQIIYNNSQTIRYFDNNSAIGLEPTITLIQQRITRIKGVLRYLVATLKGILENPSWDVVLEWDGGFYEGPMTLVTIGNNPLTGGMFYMTPHADPSDGLLTFVYAYMPTRFKILKLLPKTMKPGEGSYVEHPDVHEIHSPWLRIKTIQPTPLHADGEIQSESEHDIEYRVDPAKLTILIH